uniref:Centrosomal protein 20 n=1 Tax=Strigamia maritima TaxID=126957 RepID=T1JPF1_STRMM
MATVDELKSVLKETLNRRGILGQLKARIRAEVFQALDDQSETRPSLSNENLLINELIREYLEFNQYRYSASVLKAESGQPDTSFDHDFLKAELNLPEDNDPTPTQKNDQSRQTSNEQSAGTRNITIHHLQDEKDLSLTTVDRNV